MGISEALDSEYESGVADVLAFLAAGVAMVDRNIRLPGRHSGTMRQLDIVVRGQVFGMADGVMVVDCKRWNTSVDVADVGSFIDLVEDVGADIGMLVTTKAASAAATQRTQNARGVRLELMTLDELQRWRPAGTVTTDYRIPRDQFPAAARALRRTGYRVAGADLTPPDNDEGLVISVFRHWGTRNATVESQAKHHEQTEAALRSAGVIEAVHVSTSVSVLGGTPGHRWLDVTVGDARVGLKILAANDNEAEKQLAPIRESYLQQGIPTDVVSFARPDDWPVTQLFGGPIK